MLGAVAFGVVLVVTVDRFYGHSALAFAAAILLLLIVNGPILRFNCPQCGKNAFVRGVFVIPWPNRICTRCKLDLAKTHSQKR